MNEIGPSRLYGAAIALASGSYALAVSLAPMLTGEQMPMADQMGLARWLMALLGVVVLVHGVLLLTPAAGRISRLSGPLMVVWGALMLLNQLLLGGQMGGAMGGAAFDPGMVALAALMVVSGLIMLRRMPGEEM